MPNAKLIDGKAYAAKLRENIAANVSELKSKYHITPGLAVILVGEDPASQVYVRNKRKQTLEAGMQSFEYNLPVSVTQLALLDNIHALNKTPHVHGILVQLPLPKHIEEHAIIQAIAPEKDVDGFHVINAGLLATGQQGMVPCTPLGCVMLLKSVHASLRGLHAVVIGRSNIVGKPIAQLLLQEDCTVTIVHSRTPHPEALCRQADIIVSAVGKAGMVKNNWIKPGATVIDVGINRITLPDGTASLCGDVAFEEAVKVAGAITPVPGGVGPMTIACLLQNTLTATCKQHNITPFNVLT